MKDNPLTGYNRFCMLAQYTHQAISPSSITAGIASGGTDTGNKGMNATERKTRLRTRKEFLCVRPLVWLN